MNILFNNIGKLSKNVYNEQQLLDKYLDKITMDEEKLLDIFSNMKILIYENQDNNDNNDNNLLLSEFNKLKSDIIILEENLKLQLKELNNVLNYLNNLNNLHNNDIKLIQNEKKNISKKLKSIKSLIN